VLNSSYRSPLTFNEEVIAQSERALERLRSALRPAPGEASTTGLLAAPSPEALAALPVQTEATRQGFLAAMDDDFNTAGALGQLFGLVRVINQARDAGAGSQDLKPAQSLLSELADVLGLRLATQETGNEQAGLFVELLLEIRQELRRQKLWALSDQIRDRLATLGVVVEDGQAGASWRWK